MELTVAWRPVRTAALAFAVIAIGWGGLACSDDDSGPEPAGTGDDGVNGAPENGETPTAALTGETPEPEATGATASVPPPTATTGNAETPAAPPPEGRILTVHEAIAIAQQEAEGDVLGIDAGLDRGAITYEIEIETTSIAIDAATGSILAVTEEREDDDEPHEPVTFPENALTPLEAIAIAEERAGTPAEDLEIDDFGGAPVYVVEAGDLEISVDVVSGEIVEIDD